MDTDSAIGFSLNCLADIYFEIKANGWLSVMLFIYDAYIETVLYSVMYTCGIVFGWPDIVNSCICYAIF